MIAVFVNCLTVIVGGTLGVLVGKKVSDSFKEIVFSCSGMITSVMGIQMALQSTNFLVLLFAMLCGGVLGYAVDVEGKVFRFGEKLEKKMKNSKSGNGNFALGFLNASVLFCSGAMAVVGSIQAGTSGDFNTIFIKSVLDGFMAIVLASIYGIGVAFSCVFIFVYQGFFTLAGSWIEPVLGEVGITELSAAGGILIIMISAGLLDIKKFKAGNFTPALIFAPIFAILTDKLF